MVSGWLSQALPVHGASAQLRPRYALLALTGAVLALHWIALQPTHPQPGAAPSARTVPLTEMARPSTWQSRLLPSTATRPAPRSSANLANPAASRERQAEPVRGETDIASARTVAPRSATTPLLNPPTTALATPPAPSPPTSHDRHAPAPTPLPPPGPDDRLPQPDDVWVLPATGRMRYAVTSTRPSDAPSTSAWLSWTTEGQTYRVELLGASARWPARSQRSLGLIGPSGLAPQDYVDQGRRAFATHVEGDRVRFSAKTAPAPRAEGLQDRASVWIQIAARLQGRPWRAGQTLTLPVANARDVEMWHLVVGAPEQMNVGDDTVRVLPLRHEPVAAYGQHIELWVAPAWQHWPVRLRWRQANGGELVLHALGPPEWAGQVTPPATRP